MIPINFDIYLLIQNDSDNDVKEMGEIEEIIGINNKDIISELKTSNNKTSIMTSSTGKSLKRKHDDEHTIVEEEASVGKKLATEKIMDDKPEITITLKSKEAEVA